MTDTIQKIADEIDAKSGNANGITPALLMGWAKRLRALSARASAGEGVLVGEVIAIRESGHMRFTFLPKPLAYEVAAAQPSARPLDAMQKEPFPVYTAASQPEAFAWMKAGPSGTPLLHTVTQNIKIREEWEANGWVSIPIFLSTPPAHGDGEGVPFDVVREVVKARTRLGFASPEGQEEQAARAVELIRELCEEVIALTTRPTPEAQEARDDLRAEIDRLNAIINTPHTDDFLQAVSIEAEHQRQRWGSDHDAGKTAEDWFWLVGYLAGKALHSTKYGMDDKALHHVITTASALLNWWRAMRGETNMRPGIDGAAALALPAQGEGK